MNFEIDTPLVISLFSTYVVFAGVVVVVAYTIKFLRR